MKVLVTGSEGFLGRHVCTALKQHGYAVIGLDSSPTADVVADVTKVMPLMQVDAVIHLAAVAAPSVCDQNPELAFNVNVNGTYQVLRLALESGAKKFVFSSSAHVYGISPRYMPTDESHPLWLQNTYTTTKILGEQLCELFYKNDGLSYTTLRLFNVYGPGQMKGYFIPDMIAKARQGLIRLDGHKTTKDFVYVDDVADAFCRAVETNYVGPINIGTGEETSLGSIASYIASRMDASFYSGVTLKDTHMMADCDRAELVLEWVPTITIKDGLDATITAAKERSLVS